MAKVKVRIALVVGEDSNWASSGWGDDYSNEDKIKTREKDAMGIAMDGLAFGLVAKYWIDAEVDIPNEKIIKGDIKDG